MIFWEKLPNQNRVRRFICTLQLQSAFCLHISFMGNSSRKRKKMSTSWLSIHWSETHQVQVQKPTMMMNKVNKSFYKRLTKTRLSSSLNWLETWQKKDSSGLGTWSLHMHKKSSSQRKRNSCNLDLKHIKNKTGKITLNILVWRRRPFSKSCKNGL